MKFILLTISLLFMQNAFSYSKSITHPDYAKNGFELCDYLDDAFGFHSMTLFCAIKMDDATDFCTSLEASFCHKVISENKMKIGQCFELIIGNNDRSLDQLEECAQLSSEEQVYKCMTH